MTPGLPPPRPSRCRFAAGLSAVVILAGAGTGGGCRSGAAPKPGAPGAPPDLARSYVGQALILRHRGDDAKWSLDRKSVEKQSGECDVAVEVKEATFQKGVVQIRVECLGEPRTDRWRSKCRRQVPGVALRITGFRSDEPAEAVTAVIGRLLPTPEAWLGARGIRFDLPAAGDPKLVADRSSVAKQEEMRLARDVSRWPRRQLWVEPAYSDPGRIKHEGEIEIAGVVGTDGRLYRPQILTPLDEAHQRHIGGVFPLWRFEPARKGNEAVAARVTERTVLRIY